MVLVECQTLTVLLGLSCHLQQATEHRPSTRFKWRRSILSLHRRILQNTLVATNVAAARQRGFCKHAVIHKRHETFFQEQHIMTYSQDHVSSPQFQQTQPMFYKTQSPCGCAQSKPKSAVAHIKSLVNANSVRYSNCTFREMFHLQTYELQATPVNSHVKNAFAQPSDTTNKTFQSTRQQRPVRSRQSIHRTRRKEYTRRTRSVPRID